MSRYTGPVVVLCEGNIGSGKTTLIEGLLREVSKTGIIPIPVYEPLDDEIMPLLTEFYEDLTSACYELERLFVTKRHEATTEALAEAQRICDDGGRALILVDRSIYGNSCFLNKVYETGRVTDDEYASLRELESRCMDDLPVDVMLYLNVSPDVCAERIMQRGREGEQDIPIEYLEHIESEHRAMIKKNDGRFPIVIIQRSDDPQRVLSVAQNVINALFN